MLTRTNFATKYIDILKKSLNNDLYIENEARCRLAMNALIENRIPTPEQIYDLTPHDKLINALMKSKNNGNTLLYAFKDGAQLAHFMRNYLEISHTMIGRKRLENIQYCMETVLDDNIPEDIIETGI